MDKKVVYGLIQRLNLKPVAGSKLAVFLSKLDNQSADVDDPSISGDQDKNTSTNNSDQEIINSAKAGDPSIPADKDENTLIDNSDQEIINGLKRIQIITLTRPILELSMRAQTPLELNKAKSAGVESLIDIPEQISGKLNSLGIALESSLKDFIEIKETGTEELNKKFNLVVPPTGLNISVVLTLFVAALTVLVFVILKAEDMLGSPEAYWGFFSAGILILLGINAVIINLIKSLRFKKNRDSILIEAKRIFVENKHLKHSKFKKKIEDESFQIQKREYSQAAELKFKEIGREEQSIRESLNA